ncbi:MAG: hypothetical protein ACKOSQ_12430 [Planctomycetaceae bacterium]
MLIASRLAIVASLMSVAVSAADTDPAPAAELTAARASQLVADGGRAMSPAEILATTRLGLSGPIPEKAGILALPDVKRLAPGAAAALARYEGAVLALDGLDDLSAEAAAALATFTHEDDVLDLGEDVTHLHPWFGFLSLGGLPTLAPDAAAALSACEVNLLLDGLTTLSPEAATALAAHRGVLSLESLRTISAAAAAALATHRGEHLVLDGLTTLSPETAAALSRYEGARLSLSGLEELSVETARPRGLQGRAPAAGTDVALPRRRRGPGPFQEPTAVAFRPHDPADRDGRRHRRLSGRRAVPQRARRDLRRGRPCALGVCREP